MDPAAYDDAEVSPSTLKLSHLLWRPWYAKAWWTSAAVFWTAVAFVPWAARATDDGIGFVLSLFVHPFALIWYLAGLYLWGWRQGLAYPWNPSSEGRELSAEELAEIHAGENFGFDERVPMSYLSDPTDIRSPMNPANPGWIGRHRR